MAENKKVDGFHEILGVPEKDLVKSMKLHLCSTFKEYEEVRRQIKTVEDAMSEKYDKPSGKGEDIFDSSSEDEPVTLKELNYIDYGGPMVVEGISDTDHSESESQPQNAPSILMCGPVWCGGTSADTPSTMCGRTSADTLSTMCGGTLADTLSTMCGGTSADTLSTMCGGTSADTHSTMCGGTMTDTPTTMCGGTSADTPSTMCGGTSTYTPTTMSGGTSADTPSTMCGGTSAYTPTTMCGGTSTPTTMCGGTSADTPSTMCGGTLTNTPTTTMCIGVSTNTPTTMYVDALMDTPTAMHLGASTDPPSTGNCKYLEAILTDTLLFSKNKPTSKNKSRGGKSLGSNKPKKVSLKEKVDRFLDKYWLEKFNELKKRS